MSFNTPNIQKLVAGNKEYVANLPDTEKNLPLPPANNFIIITCMDARLHPGKAFGLDLGSTHVIRNAGGSARDSLRSLVISQQLLGTKEIAVVKHTDCGMLTFKNEDLYGAIEKNLGVKADRSVDYFTFSDIEKAVVDDVEFLKASELITAESKTKVSGWVYDVKDGSVKRVV